MKPKVVIVTTPETESNFFYRAWMEGLDRQQRAVIIKGRRNGWSFLKVANELKEDDDGPA